MTPSGRAINAKCLDETATTAFCVDASEPLLFLALLDHTHGSHEKHHQDGSEAVDGRERVHQHIVRKAYKLHVATIIQSNGRVCAETCRLDNGVVRESAAFQQVLDSNSPFRSGVLPDIPKVCIFLKGHEPKVSTKEDGYHGIGNKDPVEYRQSNGDVILLNDGSYRYDEGRHIHYAKDETEI